MCSGWKDEEERREYGELSMEGKSWAGGGGEVESRTALVSVFKEKGVRHIEV